MSRKVRALKSGLCEVTQDYKAGVHNGIDIVRQGYQLDYIVAHSDGKIIQAQDGLGNMKGTNSYGNYVKIDHGNGYWQQIYCTLKGSFDTSTNKYNVTKIDMSSDYTSLQSIQPRLNSEVANKQYVDSTHYKNMTGYDATKTHVLKNINGTLTWVNE